MVEGTCEHTADDNDLGFQCENEQCPVHVANEEYGRRMLQEIMHERATRSYPLADDDDDPYEALRERADLDRKRAKENEVITKGFDETAR